MAFAVKENDIDTPNWYKVINSTHAEDFLESVWLEIMTLIKIKVWDLVPLTEDMKVLPFTWDFRIKHLLPVYLGNLKPDLL